jgi:hypothetical protein
MKDYGKLLKPLYGKRCVINGASTYEGGLYFYAFDQSAEAKLSKEIIDQVVGSWDVIEEIGVVRADVVMFGATVSDDLDEEAPEEATRAIKKHGLVGLAKVGLSTPCPLFYDRATGNAYFLPDGTPSALSRDGKKSCTLDKVKLRAV